MWYEIINNNNLEQGDLIFDCPIFQPISDLDYPLDVDLEGQELVQMEYNDVIIISQSCDLENDKVEEVILCPQFKNKDEKGEVIFNKDKLKSITKGYMPRYFLLDKCNNDTFPLEYRIVDFGKVFYLPKSFVLKFILKKPRLRLKHPYKEFLSQSFAKFFMRVGLPKSIEL